VTCNVSLYADDTLLYSVVRNDDDEKKFQDDIDSLHDWSERWKMPFNTTKCEVIIFGNNSRVPPTYTLGGVPLKSVPETTYLRVTFQSDLKFNRHITAKVNTANKVLGSIKFALHNAPEKDKLLAYTSLCRPVLEYADTLWDPADNSTAEEIELTQSKAIRFVKGIKGRRGITDARSQLELQPLKDRRKNHRLSLLMRILSDEENHEALTYAYDEVINNRANATMVTRAATRGEPTAIFASSKLYHNSFLPRTVRDLRLGPSNTQP
jgi:hypothetical protein